MKRLLSFLFNDQFLAVRAHSSIGATVSLADSFVSPFLFSKQINQHKYYSKSLTAPWGSARAVPYVEVVSQRTNAGDRYSQAAYTSSTGGKGGSKWASFGQSRDSRTPAVAGSDARSTDGTPSHGWGTRKSSPSAGSPQPLYDSGVKRWRSRHNVHRFNALQKWLARVREDVKSADQQVTPPAAAADDATASARAPQAEALAGDMVPRLLRQPAEEGLRPLGSRLPRGLQGAAPARFDPKLLPDVVRVFHQASQRLRFTTQLPQAVATYVAAAAQRGSLDLAAYDVSFCKELVMFLGAAQVVNRDCLDELRKALQARWGQLPPGDLVAVLAALGRLNDADRVVSSGRPSGGSSRLLRMLVDAEPCVTGLLDAAAAGPPPPPLPHPQAAAAAAAAAPGAGLKPGGTLPPPPGAALQLALVYLSFYRSATSGHQHFATAPMLQHHLEMCLAQVDPADGRQAPAEELGRLVAGLVGVTLLRSHGLALHLPRLINAVMRRSAEFPQPVRALLQDLPQQHWALPPTWWRTLSSRTAPHGGSGRSADRRA